MTGQVRNGAGDGIRTRDINLGKVALYQLSYSRLTGLTIFQRVRRECQIVCVVCKHRMGLLWKTYISARLCFL
jgi:hypothetical protein